MKASRKHEKCVIHPKCGQPYHAQWFYLDSSQLFWKFFFAKIFAVSTLTMTLLSIGIDEHGLSASLFIENSIEYWRSFTRWALSIFDIFSLFIPWNYEDHEKDLTAAHIIAFYPFIYSMSKISIKLSIYGILYIFLYLIVFGTSPEGEGGFYDPIFRGWALLIMMIIFASLMSWFLAKNYIEKDLTTKSEVIKLIMISWSNSAGGFSVVILLYLSGIIEIVNLF